MQDRQTVGAGRLDHVDPPGAGLHGDQGGGRVDVHAAHRAGAQQDGVGQVSGHRAGAVTGALRGHAQAQVDGGGHDGRDLVGAARQGDGGGTQVAGEVPRQAGGLVVGLTGQVEGHAGDAVAQLVGGGGRDDGGHGDGPSGSMW